VVREVDVALPSQEELHVEKDPLTYSLMYRTRGHEVGVAVEISHQINLGNQIPDLSTMILARSP